MTATLEINEPPELNSPIGEIIGGIGYAIEHTIGIPALVFSDDEGGANVSFLRFEEIDGPDDLPAYQDYPIELWVTNNTAGVITMHSNKLEEE